jgi:hypothetical protein
MARCKMGFLPMNSALVGLASSRVVVDVYIVYSTLFH